MQQVGAILVGHGGDGTQVNRKHERLGPRALLLGRPPTTTTTNSPGSIAAGVKDNVGDDLLDGGSVEELDERIEVVEEGLPELEDVGDGGGEVGGEEVGAEEGGATEDEVVGGEGGFFFAEEVVFVDGVEVVGFGEVVGVI